MKLYNYHPIHKYFLYSEEAKQSPLDPIGTWLIPANSTDIEPPKTTEDEIAYWNGKCWEIKKIQSFNGNYCPLLKNECIKTQCSWYVKDQCAVTLLPLLLKLNG
jgi:hypothetical protein